MQSKLVNADYKDIHEEHMQALFNGPSGDFEMFSGLSLWQLRHSVSEFPNLQVGHPTKKNLCSKNTYKSKITIRTYIAIFKPIRLGVHQISLRCDAVRT